MRPIACLRRTLVWKHGLGRGALLKEGCCRFRHRLELKERRSSIHPKLRLEVAPHLLAIFLGGCPCGRPRRPRSVKRCRATRPPTLIGRFARAGGGTTERGSVHRRAGLHPGIRLGAQVFAGNSRGRAGVVAAARIVLTAGAAAARRPAARGVPAAPLPGPSSPSNGMGTASPGRARRAEPPRPGHRARAQRCASSLGSGLLSSRQLLLELFDASLARRASWPAARAVSCSSTRRHRRSLPAAFACAPASACALPG